MILAGTVTLVGNRLESGFVPVKSQSPAKHHFPASITFPPVFASRSRRYFLLRREAVEEALAADLAQFVDAAARRGVRRIPRRRILAAARRDRGGRPGRRRRRHCSSSCCRSPQRPCRRALLPVRMSWRFGVSPRPLLTSPFSFSEFSFDSLLLSLCRSATLAATCTPLALNHGPGADAVFRVHARLAVGARRAEIGAPHPSARTGRLRQRRAVRVCAREPAEIRALARIGAGDEEAQRVSLRIDR